MCQYCDIEEYCGEDLPLTVEVDGSKQHWESYLRYDEEHSYIGLVIWGTFSELNIKINHCPMCGKKLN